MSQIVLELKAPIPNPFNFSNIYFKYFEGGEGTVTLFIDDDDSLEQMRAYALLNPFVKPITLNREQAFRMKPDEYIAAFGSLKFKELNEGQKKYTGKHELYQEVLKKYS